MPLLAAGQPGHHGTSGFLHRYSSAQHVPHPGRTDDGKLHYAEGGHRKLVGDAASDPELTQRLPLESFANPRGRAE